jgi:hypothetical protein
MTRRCLMMLFASLCARPLVVDAQHHSGMHGFHFQHYYQSYGSYPVYMTGGYWPQNYQFVSYYPPMTFAPFAPVIVPAVGSKGPQTPSTPAARLKSIDYQNKGDQRLLEQKWPEAKALYTSAVKAAPDRSEAHFRLAIGYVAIHRFESAITEFKLALLLEPSIAKNTKKFDVIFGPDGKIAVNSMISKLGDWVGDDIRNSDRLFLLGVILFLNRDPRADDAFQAAYRTSKSSEVGHITAFLSPPHEQGLNLPEPGPVGLPNLKEQPAAPATSPADVDLRFPKLPKNTPAAPVPMP